MGRDRRDRVSRQGSIAACAILPPLAQQASFTPMAFDEMVDGNRGVRPGWRGLLGVLAGLGRETLVERAARLDRMAAEEGPPSVPPGARDPWRFDPIPLLL